MNWSIRAKLMGLASVSLVMVILTGVVGYCLLKTPVQMIRDQAMASQAQVNHMQGDMMHDALRGDVLSSLAATKEADWEDCRKAMGEHAALFREMLHKNTQLPLDPEIKSELAKLAPKLETYIKAAETTLGASFKDRAASAQLLPKFLDAFEEMEKAQGTLSDLFKDRAEAFVVQNGKTMAHASLMLAVLALAACFIIVATSVLITRSISGALNKVIASLSEGSQQVSAASIEVSSSSQHMAEGASEQASSLEETSASLEQMSSMTKQNSDNARQANSMAENTHQAVEKSRTAMTRMSEAIGLIKNSSDQTAKIVKTIDEIAFQTNLLALNAAVEAARAGDAGKGFAVVAEEVRNLAQRSAEAARSTSSLIEDSQKNADNGVAVSQEVAGILGQIVESVNKLGQLIGEVSNASQEQAKGIEQIGVAVTEMDKLTQSNAASAEESASASEELSAQANELNDMVNTLVAIVTGSAAAAMRQVHRPAAKKPVHEAARSSAQRGSASAPAAKKAQAKQDWSPASGGNNRNGHAAPARKAAHAESVIPLSDDELKDF